MCHQNSEIGECAVSVYGIDVSHWQGTQIDWTAVSASGIKFAIIKASEGSGWVDSDFDRNIREARKNGISSGAYHFFRPGWDTREQAQHFFDVVGHPRPGDLIPWLDVEDYHKWTNGPLIPEDQVVSELVEVLLAMDGLFGVKVGVYTASWCFNGLPVKWEMDRPLWVASWTGKPGIVASIPNGWSDYSIHQYGATPVPGIGGNVDRNWAREIDSITVKRPDDPSDEIVAKLLQIKALISDIERLV